jgi:hypothetical protein
MDWFGQRDIFKAAYGSVWRVVLNGVFVDVPIIDGFVVAETWMTSILVWVPTLLQLIRMATEY